MGGLATLNDVIMGRELAADPARQPGQAQLGKTGRRLSVLMVLTPHTQSARLHGSRRLGLRCATTEDR